MLDDEWALDAIRLVDRTHAFSAVHMNHSRYIHIVVEWEDLI